MRRRANRLHHTLVCLRLTHLRHIATKPTASARAIVSRQRRYHSIRNCSFSSANSMMSPLCNMRCFLAHRLTIDPRIAATLDVGDEVALWSAREDRQSITALAQCGDDAIEIDDAACTLSREYLDPALGKANLAWPRRRHARNCGGGLSSFPRFAGGPIEAVDKHRALQVDR